jgi:NAD(P)H-hydrate epimerase
MADLLLTRAQVRELDRRAIEEWGLPGVVLMENAGRGTAELLLALGARGPVVICCGKGNNGGDGFVIARHLDNRGVPVHVLLFADPDELRGDAAVNYRVLARSGVALTALPARTPPEAEVWEELESADWVVDALFGTGLNSPVRPPLDGVIARINDGAAPVLAVDLPSGLDCDTGRPLGPTVRAQHTATMAARKKGFAEPDARPWLGEVHVIDIGVPRPLLAEAGAVTSPGP